MDFLKKSVTFEVPPPIADTVDYAPGSEGLEMSKSVITYSRNCF